MHSSSIYPSFILQKPLQHPRAGILQGYCSSVDAECKCAVQLTAAEPTCAYPQLGKHLLRCLKIILLVFLFILCVPGYCSGREENPNPLIVTIKTTALDFIQHLHPHFGSQESALIPKALASGCSCTVGLHWLSRELFSPSFWGWEMVNTSCISLHASHSAPLSAVPSITVRGAQ